MSPFTSLPEIRSFVAQNCSDNSKTLNDKLNLPILSVTPSWKKSDSWSWKSTNAIQLNPSKNHQHESNSTHKDTQCQVSQFDYSALVFL
jgi:hypothetical protein